MNARMLSGTNHTKLNMKAAIIRKKTPSVENVGRPLTVGQTSLGLRIHESKKISRNKKHAFICDSDMTKLQSINTSVKPHKCKDVVKLSIVIHNLVFIE